MFVIPNSYWEIVEKCVSARGNGVAIGVGYKVCLVGAKPLPEAVRPYYPPYYLPVAPFTNMV